VRRAVGFASLAAFLLALAVLPPATALAAASLGLSPTAAPPGSSVTVGGTGFGPGETVRIAFDGSALRSVVSDGSGAFGTSVVIPSTATPGPHAVTATGLTTSATASATFTVRSNWINWRYDNQHDGYNPHETGIGRSNAASLVAGWTHAFVDAYTVSSPVVYKGRMYVEVYRCVPFGGDCEDHLDVRALDEASGGTLWHVDTGCNLLGAASPAIDTRDGTVVGTGTVGCFSNTGEGSIFALSLHAKAPAQSSCTWLLRCLWYRQTEQVAFTPTARAGYVYVHYGVATDDPAPVGRFRGADGSVRWNSPLDAQNPGMYLEGGDPTVAAPFVYYENGSRFSALDLRSGSLAWSKGRVTGTAAPAEGDGFVVFDRGGGSLAAYDESAPAVAAWREPGRGTPAIADGAVYSACGAGGICAYRLATGAPIWDTNTTLGSYSKGVSDAVVANGLVYFRTGGGRIVVVNSSTGALATTLYVGSGPTVPPVVVNGRVIAQTTTSLKTWTTP